MTEEFMENIPLMENFDYLSLELNWEDIKEKRNEFDWLVGEIAREKHSSLKELHKIIKRYKKTGFVGRGFA